MMNFERRFGAFARVTCARTCAYVALFGLLLATGPALAADAAHARPRHGALSAGTTEARGHVVETSVARRSGRGAHGRAAKINRAAEAEQAKSVSRANAKKNARGEMTLTGRRRGRAKREIAVETPPVMSRAELRRARMRDVAVTKKAGRKSEPKADRAGVDAKVAETPVVAVKKPATVDDFVKAATGGGFGQSDATQGVAHPDESEPVETAVVQPDETVKTATLPRVNAGQRSIAGSKTVEQAKAMVPSKAALPGTVATSPKAALATQKPAPVERVDVAEDAVVAMKTKPGPQAGVSFSDAPAFADLPHQRVGQDRVVQDRVVQGFGGEVDVVPTRTGKASKAVAPVSDAELDANGRALERELNDEAMKPVVVPLYTRSGKLMVPAPLKGTREILVHQNTMADQAGLTRIQDDEDLNRMRAAHLLLPLPDIASLDINEELPANRRYARPWTVKFVNDIAHAYYARFHEPLYLSSAVRTVAFQLRLQRVNGNAAAVDGDTASPHLTGQAIDFAKGGMSRAEIAWMRAYLLPVMQAGKIDVEEEFQQSCFHISVYAGYVPKKKVLRQDVAEVRNGRE